MADKVDNIKTRVAFDGEAEYKAACKELNSNLKLLGSEMKLVTAEYKNNAASTEALKAKQDVLKRTYDEQAKKVAETEKALENARNGSQKNEEAARRLEIALNNQKAALAKTKNELDEIDDTMKKAATEADEFGEQVEESGKQAENAEGKLEGLQNIGSGLTGVFAGLAAGAAALGGALLAGFGVSVNAADEAKGAINNYMSATGEATEKTGEYKDVMEKIYNANYGESFEDIAAAMAEVKQQAGDIGADELESITTDALMLRDTFDFEVNESVRGAEMLMNQFGLTSTQAFNLIAQGAQNGLNKNGDLLDIITEYSVQFTDMGYSAEEMFNMLANGAEAGTWSIDKLGDAAKEFNIRMSDGTAKDAVEALGFSWDKVSEGWEAGGAEAAEVMNMLLNEMEGMEDTTEGYNLGVQMFGTMWEDVGYDALLAMSKTEGAISQTVDALGQINSIKYDTFGEAMSGAGRILQTSFIIPLGEEALPIFTEFANTLSEGAAAADGDISALADTFGKAVGELVAGIGEMLPDITAMASELVLGLADGLVSSTPDIINAGVELLGNLAKGLAQALPEIAASAVEIVSTLLQGIIELLPMIIEGAIQLVVSLAQGIAEALPQLVPQIVDLVLFIVETLAENIPTIIQAAADIIVGLAQGLVDALPMLAERLPEIIVAIINGLVEALPQVIECAGEIVVALATGLVEALPVLIENLPQIVIAIVEGLGQAIPRVALLMLELNRKVWEILKELPFKIWDAIIDAIVKMAEWGIQMQDKAHAAMADMITKIINALKELPGKIWNTIITCVTKIAEWGIQMQDKAKSAVASVCTSIVNGFKDLPDKLVNIGTNIVQGLWNGINNAKDWILDKIKGFGDAVLEGLKSFFGIASPSKVMRDQVGVFLAQGIGVGFTEEMEKVSRDINNSIPREFDVRSKVNIDAETDDDYEPKKPRGSGGAPGDVIVIQNIYAKDTSYKAQQKEAAKQFKNIAREVVA